MCPECCSFAGNFLNIVIDDRRPASTIAGADRACPEFFVVQFVAAERKTVAEQ